MADYFDVERRWKQMAEQVRAHSPITASEEFEAEAMRLQDDIEILKESDPAGYGTIMATIIGDAHPPQPRVTAPVETRPTYDELVGVVREIAEGDPLVVSDHKGTRECRYCGQALVSARFTYEINGETVTADRFEFRPEMREHAADCLFVRCRALAARLPPA